MRFITKFSQQHHKLRDILNKHWPILQEDPILNKYISPFPQITFKRTKSLGDQLISSHFSVTPKIMHPKLGMAQCGKCSFCPWLKEGNSFILPNGEKFILKFYADCDTKGVVYLMMCQCGAFYVGKTIRHLRCRIRDHIYYSGEGKMITAVSRHLDLYHKFNTSLVSFIALTVIPPDPRGGEWDKKVCQQETLWIERLGATVPPGINETQSYKPFL